MTISNLQKLYDKDYYLWLEKTAAYLYNHQFDRLDVENLVEEIKSLGRKEKAELRNRLKVLFEHLLKLEYWNSQREWNERGWKLTITEQKLQIRRNLLDSPSLKSSLPALCREAYEDALIITKAKTELKNLPEQNPFEINFLD